MRWLWAVLVGLIAQGATAQNWTVQVTEPKEKALFGWAQSAPDIKVQAELRRDDERVIAKQGDVGRLFLTAQIFSGERLIDNVPLWDDGTHGDEKGNDGVFAASYRPPQTGTFRLRVRAQVDLLSGDKTFTQEFWSTFVPFRIVAIPYARLTQPEPGSEVKGKTSVRARLLLLDKPYDEPDETLQAELQVTGKSLLWGKPIPLQRQGSLLTGSVTFPKRGIYRLKVLVTVRRDGQKIQTQSEVTEVQVTTLGYLWLYVAAAFAVFFLLLPPKEPPLRYRHHLRVGEQRCELEPGERRRIGIGQVSVELEAKKDRSEIHFRSFESAQIRKGSGLPQQSVSLKEGERCRVDGTDLHYERAEPLRDPIRWWHRLIPNTLPRSFIFLCALGTLTYWLWQWHQFAR